MRKLYFFLAVIFIIPNVKVYAAEEKYSSYKDIPGVTAEMIEAVEALKQSREAFTYGAMHTTETFIGEDGQIHGFTALFCDYLSDLFGIEFVPSIYEWNDLIAGLESFELDFSGELTATDERRKKYYMTDGIAMRTINYFYLNDTEPLEDIMEKRPLRLISFPGEHSIEVMEELHPSQYEHSAINSYQEAYDRLESGEADAYITDSTVEAPMSEIGEIKTTEIYPLMYTAVSMVTQDASLEPIIAVVQKLHEAAGSTVFTEIYGKGLAEYKKYRFNTLLTDAEKAYIAGGGEANGRAGGKASGGISVAGIDDNYPISFYNESENEWQGIAYDTLNEIASFSGLTFNITDSSGKIGTEVTNMLSTGEIEMISGISHSRPTSASVKFSETPLFEDNYVLISLEETPDIQISEIFNKRVGFFGGERNEQMFRMWFPDHRKIAAYTDEEDTLNALANGDIDLAMSSRSGLLRITHYLERAGYKSNFTFNYPFDVSFGFNPDDEVLSGIINKAMTFCDISSFSSSWTDKNYDYQSALLRSQLPLIIIGISTVCVLVMTMLVLTYKSREGLRLKQQVNLQTARLSAVINGIPDLIFCKDLNLKFTMVNEGLLQFFNMKDEGEILGKGIEEAFNFTDAQKEVIKNAEKELFESSEIIRNEEHITGGDGGDYIFETVKVPIIQDGKPVGLLGISRNITERKEAEQGVRAASESKTMFLANMSHEIRTPMNSIVGFSELALSDDIAPRTRDYLSKIIDNAEWLLHIIDDILDISKIESGKLSVKNVPFDLSDILTRCQTTIAPAASEKGIKLFCYAEPTIGRRLVGDQVRLRQVLNNILSNAVKFTTNGTVKVSSSVRIIDDSHAAVLFEVKDSGIGIPPEQLESIFEPFMQADISMTRRYGGTGLGLTIAKSIIELMGGRLQVESAVGVGSKFFFELILDTVEVDEEEKKKIAADADIPKPNFDAHVLLCEDNAMNQMVIIEHLKKVGITTTLAENGRIGVDAVKSRIKAGEKPFDLIFMDIHMPEMDGLEAASRIIKLGTGTPIIALTANIMSNDVETYRENGMPDCVGKPFTSQELWKCLLKYLEPAAGK